MTVLSASGGATSSAFSGSGATASSVSDPVDSATPAASAAAFAYSSARHTLREAYDSSLLGLLSLLSGAFPLLGGDLSHGC